MEGPFVTLTPGTIYSTRSAFQDTMLGWRHDYHSYSNISIRKDNKMPRNYCNTGIVFGRSQFYHFANIDTIS